MTLDFLFLVLALILFILSAAGVQSKVNLQSAGLAFWVATLLF